MHVYTMVTRAYAEEVCAAIDPDKSLFGGRILSRDESGSEYSIYSESWMVLLIITRLDPEESTQTFSMQYFYGSHN